MTASRAALAASGDTPTPDPTYRRTGPRRTGEVVDPAADLAAVERLIAEAPEDYPGLPLLRRRRDELARFSAPTADEVEHLRDQLARAHALIRKMHREALVREGDAAPADGTTPPTDEPGRPGGLLEMELDVAHEAAVDAAGPHSLLEHAALIEDLVLAGVDAAIRRLASLGYPIVLGPAPTVDTAAREPADLDTLTGWAQTALDSSDIRVTVQEADGSASPLRRLVRCLRSAGLLNEDAGDAAETSTEWGVRRDRTGQVNNCGLGGEAFARRTAVCIVSEPVTVVHREVGPWLRAAGTAVPDPTEVSDTGAVPDPGEASGGS